MVNMNEDIIIRNVNISDYYQGMIVQSFQNVDDLFELSNIDGRWCYRVVYNIPKRHYPFFDADLKDIDTGEYNISKIHDQSRYDMHTDDDFNWCQTLYTQRVDKKVIRNTKLDELGI